MLPLLTDILPSLYGMLQSRVIFGVGSIEKLPEEFERLGASKALVLSTPAAAGARDGRRRPFGSASSRIFRPRRHACADRNRASGPRRGAPAGCRLLRRGRRRLHHWSGESHRARDPASPLPILALPTSYAGSEMTPIWGLTQDGRKITGRDARVLPRTVLYDPALTVSMPAGACRPPAASTPSRIASRPCTPRTPTPVISASPKKAFARWPQACP